MARIYWAAADEEKANLARRRSSLRLLCELYRVGLHHECLAILEIIRSEPLSTS